MSIIKPEAILPQPVANLCPICGKASYSRGGIHPQCAIQQADEPRMVRLRAEKKAVVAVPKITPRAYMKKCPECDAESHVRRAICECGFKFSVR